MMYVFGMGGWIGPASNRLARDYPDAWIYVLILAALIGIGVAAYKIFEMKAAEKEQAERDRRYAEARDRRKRKWEAELKEKREAEFEEEKKCAAEPKQLEQIGREHVTKGHKMFCGDCGTSLQDGQQFCHECGTVNDWGNDD